MLRNHMMFCYAKLYFSFCNIVFIFKPFHITTSSTCTCSNCFIKNPYNIYNYNITFYLKIS